MPSSCQVGSFIDTGDVDKVIRYMNGAPLSVAISSPEAMSHDVERYCAFKQNAFHESERQNDKSMTYLQRARDTRVKLLENLDKYAFFIMQLLFHRIITVVHLLTNTSWGEPTPIRFLSCRQSAPQRDRLLTTGDRDVAVTLLAEVSEIQKTVEMHWKRHSATKEFVKDLKNRQAVTEMRISPSGIQPCLELLPSVWPKKLGSVAGIHLENMEPVLKVNSLLDGFLKNRFELTISVLKGHPEGDQSMEAIPDKDMDQTSRAQLCALDLEIVRLLQGSDQPSCCESHRFSKVQVSRSYKDFSVLFSVSAHSGENPATVMISMGRSGRKGDFPLVNAVRSKLLALLTSPCLDPTRELSACLADEIHRRLS